MDTILYIIACLMFLISIAGYIFVRLRLRPKDDSDLDDYYHEFEEQHPGYAKYLKWSKITFKKGHIGPFLGLFAVHIWLFQGISGS